MHRGVGLLAVVLLFSGCASEHPVRWAFNPHQEEGIHGDVEVEWWYHWGFLTDEAGNEWTAFSAFFRTWKKDLPITRYFLYDLTNGGFSGLHDYVSRYLDLFVLKTVFDPT